MLDLAEIDMLATEPRPALVMEMVDAGLHVLDKTLPEVARHWWSGVYDGYNSGFGLKENTAVSYASRFPYAQPDLTIAQVTEHVDRNTHLTNARAAEFAWACGVLYGYKMSTSERDDATECGWCERRICTGFDDYTHCGCVSALCADTDCFNDFPHDRACLREQGVDDAAEAFIDSYYGN